jgi:hypothetical protein
MERITHRIHGKARIIHGKARIIHGKARIIHGKARKTRIIVCARAGNKPPETLFKHPDIAAQLQYT